MILGIVISSHVLSPSAEHGTGRVSSSYTFVSRASARLRKRARGGSMTELMDTARVRAAHERFVTTGQLSSRAVRSLVADSWRRSQRSGVDPEVPNAPVDMGGNDLTGYRSSLALAAAMPVVRDLLV